MKSTSGDWNLFEDFSHYDSNLLCAGSESVGLGSQIKSNILIFFAFQEKAHATDMESRAIKYSKAPEEMKDGQSMVEDAQLPLEQKKRKIQRNLRTLEEMGHMSSKNKYQDILNAIAKVFGNNNSFLAAIC